MSSSSSMYVPTLPIRSNAPSQTPAQTLRPSLVKLAFSGTGPEARDALSTLYSTYRGVASRFIARWLPPARRSSEQVEELLQEFFTQRIERLDLVKHWDPDRTRFRTWLLASLRHFLLNQHRRESSKRARPAKLVSLEGLEATRRRVDPGHRVTPLTLFARDWARVVVRRALAVLHDQYAQRGKLELYQCLAPYIAKSSQRSESPPYPELSRRLGKSALSLRQDMLALRRSWNLALRGEIAQTVPMEEVDDEIRFLLDCLSQRERN